MGLLRLLLVALMIYFLIRLVKRMLQPAKKNPNIKGKQDQSKGRNPDIEDADYEEIE